MCVCIFSRSDLLERFAKALLTLGKVHFLNERFLYIHKTCLKASLEVHIFYIYAFRWGFFFIVNPLASCAESSVSPR